MNNQEFKDAMASLPEPPDTGELPPHWSFWRRQLWQLGQAEDVSTFWKWPPVYHTMLVNHFPIGHQLLYLQEEWHRWGPIVSERTNEANGRNIINQAYHLRKWEQATGLRIDLLDSILEFGGGYGAMALVCKRLGFKGKYFIADLPEFALLSQWWLSQQGIEVGYVNEPIESDLEIMIYSISEIPIADRRRWIGQARSYLILYSDMWADINNSQWMQQVIEESDSEMSYLRWNISPFPGRPDFYGIGWSE